MQRSLGRGALGEVQLCRENGGQREVAVRTFAVSLADDRTRLGLQTELLAAGAAASHPCAVPIEQVWENEQTRAVCCLAEYCAGGSAQDLLVGAGPMAADDVVVLGLRLTAALMHAHHRGVLHLDVRPANVFRDDQGRWRLGDFAVAAALRRVAPGQAVPDPHYAPRELLGWEAPGPAADVYGLGATLYATLAGAAPPDDAAVADALAAGGSPDAPPQLTGLIARMCAADPETRPPLTEVDRVLRGLLPAGASAAAPALEPAPPPPTLPFPRLPESMQASVDAPVGTDPKTRRILIGCGVGVAVLALGATALIVTGGSEDDAPPAAAPAANANPAPANPPAAEAAGAPPAAPGGAPPGGAGSAKAVPPAQRAQFVAQQVRVTQQESSVLVSWAPPRSSATVTGFVVVAQSGDGTLQSQQFAQGGQRQAVFTIPPVTASSCFVVSTLVGDPGGVQIAKGSKNCLKGK